MRYRYRDCPKRTFWTIPYRTEGSFLFVEPPHLEGEIDFVNKYLPLLLPLIVIQLGLMIYCLIDLSRRAKVRRPKWLWAIIIILGELIGPVAYLLVGRSEE